MSDNTPTPDTGCVFTEEERRAFVQTASFATRDFLTSVDRAARVSSGGFYAGAQFAACRLALYHPDAARRVLEDIGPGLCRVFGITPEKAASVRQSTAPIPPAGAWANYKRKRLSEMRPYVPGEDMAGVSISQSDKDAGSPKLGDMIARNTKNHADQWLVAKKYFEDNLEPA